MNPTSMSNHPLSLRSIPADLVERYPMHKFELRQQLRDGLLGPRS